MVIDLTYDKDQFTLLLISDTHIYDAHGNLPDKVISQFRKVGPDLILHCGDICSRHLLGELETIADVYAVRGNRDILNWFCLPASLDICVNGLRIHAEHGQGNFLQYLCSKIYVTLCKLLRKTPDYQKVVHISGKYQKYDLFCFGHSHERFIGMSSGTLLVNPGHLVFNGSDKDHQFPSYVLLRVSARSVIAEEFIYCGDHIRKRTEKFDRV